MATYKHADTIKLARTMIDARNYAGALTALQKHLQAQPNDFEATYWYATALLKAGQASEAEAAFRRLAKQKPDDDRCSYGLALALLKLDRKDEARTWLNNALATNPRLERARKKLDALDSNTQRANEFQPKPATAHRPGTLVGQARRVRLQTRSDPWIGRAQIFTLTFVLDQHNEAGQPLPAINVQLEGAQIDGQPPADGDWVRVPGDPVQGKQLQITEFRNLTTDLVVRARSGQRTLQLAIVGAFVVAFIVFAVVLFS